MQYFLTSAALVASASLSLAAPANIVRRGTFEVNQVAHGTKFLNGPIAMMDTYNKFAHAGAVAPTEVAAAAAAAAQTGTLILTVDINHVLISAFRFRHGRCHTTAV